MNKEAWEHFASADPAAYAILASSPYRNTDKTYPKGHLGGERNGGRRYDKNKAGRGMDTSTKKQFDGFGRPSPRPVETSNGRTSVELLGQGSSKKVSK